MKSSKITIPGMEIAYKAWGSPDSPPLLAIHGWLDNANSFDLLAPYLQDTFYVIAIDLPGHGLSSHLPPGVNYYFIEGLFHILKIIKALDYQQVHLLGHSLGACLASMIAGIAPDRILSTGLIEALGPIAKPEGSCQEQLSHCATQIWQEPKPPRAYPSMELAVQARAKNGYLAKEYVELLAIRGLVKKQDKYYWRHDKRLVAASPLKLTERQITSCLEEISCRTCLILADKGFQFEGNVLAQRQGFVKDLQVFQVAGGHHVHMEKPKEVSECLLQFYHTSLG